MTESSVRCPRCHAIGLREYSVKYSDGNKTLSYQCGGCGHTWQTTMKPSWPPASRNQ